MACKNGPVGVPPEGQPAHAREGVGGAGKQWVWRLVCVISDEGARVKFRRRVEMTLPPSGPLGFSPESVGFWAELRDADERPRYTRIMEDPFEANVEVPGGPGEPPFSRHPAPPGGAFVVLVPDLPGADHVSLMRGEPANARGIGDTRPAEVARLPLTGEGTGRPETTAEEG